MGNRAVITTKDGFLHNGIGVYLHWNGGRDSVQAFLKYCDLRGFRDPDHSSYGFAQLARVIGNFFGDGLSIGIDNFLNLDYDNHDNGVYIIEGWNIVGRKYFDRGFEQSAYNLKEMLISIDEAQPEKERIGKDFFEAKIMKREDLKVGMRAFVREPCNGTYKQATIVGIGENRIVNGSRVLGVPYVSLYGGAICAIEDNINNYLFDDEVLVIPEKTEDENTDVYGRLEGCFS